MTLGPKSLISVRNITTSVDVNGPGKRAVLHVQGCDIGCPGCFNKDTWPWHSPKAERLSFIEVGSRLTKLSPHITISGGEPFRQKSIMRLLRHVHRRAQSVLVFSGLTWEQLRADFPDLESGKFADVIVAGPYVKERPAVGIRGSDNQEVIQLTDRLEIPDRAPRRMEISVSPEGDQMIVTGFPKHGQLRRLERIEQATEDEGVRG